MTQTTQCLCLDEAAAKLAVSPLTLRRWARDKKIESVRLGRRLLFRELAIEAFIARRIRNPQADMRR